MEKQVELSSTQFEMASQHLQQPQRKKGGFVTMPFIMANEALARVATFGLLPNMVVYLMGTYNFHLAKATQVLLLSSATSNITPLIGAFIADSCLGRFLSVGLGSTITFLGMILLWLTAMIPQAQPPPCNLETERCKSATTGQMAMLISSFALMSFGNGGLSCSMPFGADQVNKKDNPNNHRVLETFFSWYYAFTAFAVIIALTVIVYIQDHYGWKVGFGVPAVLMFMSTLFFFLASPLYVKNKVMGSLITGLAQVTVVAYKNRNLPLPPRNSVEMYHRRKDSDLLVPADKLRFLNKACIIQDPEKDIACDGSASDPWSLCTIEQVEELKAIIKVIPLWSSGIMVSINIGGSFGILQAKSLNRAIIPLASKLIGKPVRISAKRRMGIGLGFSLLHFSTAAIVETTRRRRAIKEGHVNDVHAVLNMSGMWLVPQLFLAGMAEAFNAIGQNEFYYTEFPSTMSSIASCLFGLGMAAGSALSSLIFSTVEHVTSRGGKEGWILDNINKGRYDKYYWVLALLNAVNILYYLVCSWAYGPTHDQLSKLSDENTSNEKP
ncbi:hypothetical protein PHAVU_010G148000 [Phaseolus vulgaris]